MPRINKAFLNEVSQMIKGISNAQIPGRETQSNKLYSRFYNDKKMAGEATLGQYLAYYCVMRENAFSDGKFADEKGHFTASVTNDTADYVNKMEDMIETKFHLNGFPFAKVADELGYKTNDASQEKEPFEEFDLADCSKADLKMKNDRLEKTGLSDLTPNLVEDITKGIYRDAPKSPEYQAKEAEISDETRWGIVNIGEKVEAYDRIMKSSGKMAFDKDIVKKTPVDLLAATRGENKNVTDRLSRTAEEWSVGKLYVEVNQSSKNRTFWQTVLHPIDAIREKMLANKLEAHIQNRFGMKGEDFNKFVKDSYDSYKEEKRKGLDQYLPKAPAEESVKDEKKEILETWEIVEYLKNDITKEKGLEENVVVEEATVEAPAKEQDAPDMQSGK